MDQRRRICILACAADEDVALIAKSVARAEKYSVVEPGSPDAPADLCIVLMSRAAVQDPRFLPAAGTEAARAAITWADTHQPGATILARVRPDNAPSGKVALKAGLHRDPALDDQGEDGLDLAFSNSQTDPHDTPGGGL